LAKSPAQFQTTRWSLILTAAAGSGEESRRALTALCKLYWYPVYAYLRRKGFDRDGAQDLTQDFFVRLLEKEFFSLADPARGRFRAFLFASLRHFLINEHHRARAQKRGAGRMPLPLDFQTGERRYTLEPADRRSPDVLFERQWALTVVETALGRLEAEARRSGTESRFERLKAFLTPGTSGGDNYAAAALDLGVSEGAVKVAVHRLRRRLAVLLREAVGDTVKSPEETDAEIRHLLSVLHDRSENDAGR
jgi:RNA polymerase sigma factor (sigma-70 family)